SRSRSRSRRRGPERSKESSDAGRAVGASGEIPDAISSGADGIASSTSVSSEGRTGGGGVGGGGGSGGATGRTALAGRLLTSPSTVERIMPYSSVASSQSDKYSNPLRSNPAW